MGTNSILQCIFLLVLVYVWVSQVWFKVFIYHFVLYLIHVFCYSPASSKYFEGILLIFVRRPYDIGDKVALSDPDSDTSAGGSSTWFVERVTLFTTTGKLLYFLEVMHACFGWFDIVRNRMHSVFWGKVRWYGLFCIKDEMHDSYGWVPDKERDPTLNNTAKEESSVATMDSEHLPRVSKAVVHS